MNLDRKIGTFGAGFGRMILRHRQFLQIVPTLIDAPRRAIGEQPGRIDLERDVSDHFLNQLKPAERSSESSPLLGVFDRMIERCLRQPERTGCQKKPRSLIALVQHPAAFVRAADDMVGIDMAIVEI